MNEANNKISAAEAINSAMMNCKVRIATNPRKVRNVTNKWNVLEYQMMGQVWIDQKLVVIEKYMYMENIA